MIGSGRFKFVAAILGAVLLGSIFAPAAISQDNEKKKSTALSSLPLRLIGPSYPSGRISDFAVYSGGHHHYLASTA